MKESISKYSSFCQLLDVKLGLELPEIEKSQNGNEFKRRRGGIKQKREEIPTRISLTIQNKYFASNIVNSQLQSAYATAIYRIT